MSGLQQSHGRHNLVTVDLLLFVGYQFLLIFVGKGKPQI